MSENGESLQVCPFGPGLQKYWDLRYDYFSKFDEGIQIDEEGLYSVIPEEAGLAQAEKIQGARIIDGFAGVGGTNIAYARSGKEVVAVDVNGKRLAMAKNNARIYGVDDAIEFIEGNYFDIAQTATADTIALDPPWGGPSYQELGLFGLQNFVAKDSQGRERDGKDMLDVALARFNEVVLRVPAIFDMAQLDQFGVAYSVSDDVQGDRVISKTVIFRK